MDKQKKMHPVARFFFNIAIGWDQLANAHAGGDPDETISSRLGKIARANGGKVPKHRVIARFLVWGLDRIDKNHCEEAIEEDEGKDAVFDKFDSEGVTDGY